MTRKETAEKMKRLATREERAMVAIEFFSDENNYREETIGYGDSYLPVRDDGLEIARMVINGVEPHNLL